MPFILSSKTIPQWFFYPSEHFQWVLNNSDILLFYSAFLLSCLCFANFPRFSFCNFSCHTASSIVKVNFPLLLSIPPDSLDISIFYFIFADFYGFSNTEVSLKCEKCSTNILLMNGIFGIIHIPQVILWIVDSQKYTTNTRHTNSSMFMKFNSNDRMFSWNSWKIIIRSIWKSALIAFIKNQ